MQRIFWRCLMILLVPATISAQGITGINPVYRKAQAMVNDGNATAGRALVDSMIEAAPPGSSEYVEGVYWRAVLAATAEEAETDYKRIVADHPTSPRVADALIRLGQLEIARTNYDAAIRHFNRLALEHPQSPSRARAGYWMARALFEKNDIQGGCVATSDALTRVNQNDAELRNQITYLNQRCAGVVIAGTSPSPNPSGDPGMLPPRTAGVPVGSTSVPITPDPTAGSRSTASSVIDTATRVPADTASRVVTSAAGPAAKPPMRPSPRPRDATPTMVEPVIPEPAASPDTRLDKTTSPAGTGYSVQVAAYNRKTQAEAMAERLRKRGYDTRVTGRSAPFRVRIGHYRTQSEAVAVQRSLKSKQITGFVVQAEAQ